MTTALLVILLIADLAIIPATMKWWGTDGFGGPL